MYESPITQYIGRCRIEIESELICKVEQTLGYYIDKDELVKALNYDRGQYERGYSDGLNADKWVSVKDSLPEPGQSVLIYYPKWSGDEIQVAKLSEDRLTFDICEEFYIRTTSVTHWQPLPGMPREAIIIPEEG